MTPARYFCGNLGRREAVRAHATLNGIDFLEVLDQEAPAPVERQRTLLVRCLKAVPAGLRGGNVEIQGGVRVKVRVEWAVPATRLGKAPISLGERTALRKLLPKPPEREKILVVRTNGTGDFSTYELRLVKSADEPVPPKGFDPRLSRVDFSFKVECPSDFDGKRELECPPATRDEPEIHYLAKDYASFRQLLLDRLSVVAPDWRERNPADLGMVLVELMAYVGDQLSYWQDAVANEAYLGTARQRISVRRHARLVDYFLDEGITARAWVFFRVGSRIDKLAAGTPILSRLRGQPVAITPQAAAALTERPVVFETLADAALDPGHNELLLYTWSDDECCLPAGATRATLVGTPLANPQAGGPRYEAVDPPFEPGDAILFEEVKGPGTGAPGDADPAHRHVVRLTSVESTTDPLNGQEVLEVAWDAADALPFPLCLSVAADDGEGIPASEEVSVARGNLVLADAGRSVEETLAPVPEGEPFRPLLEHGPLTHAVPLAPDWQRRPVAELTATGTAAAEPVVVLEDTAAGRTWRARRDLLASDRFAAEFAAEIRDDGRAELRFGDDRNGATPATDTVFRARYRVGNGAAGNVGVGALAHAVTQAAGIAAVRNPLPARGGRRPESLDEARRFAPQAFRVQQRAVTEDDYARVAERHPEVQKAVAEFRWTGSWHTVFVTPDRRGGLPVDADFERRLRDFLETFRMAGRDLEILEPCFIPLDLALKVCVRRGYLRSPVKVALLDRFSNRALVDGSLGLFHPDNWTFGQPVYLSRVYAAASEVEGVDSVEVVRFQRWAKAPAGELEDAVLPLGRQEIARLDNDPSLPENGRLDLDVRGGR